MRRVFLLAILLAGLSAQFASTSPGGFDYSPWDRALKKFVTATGKVDYAALKANSNDLDQFVAALAARSPVSNPQDFRTGESRLAYWINAYNALVVRGVVDNWPVHSVLDIGALPHSFFWHKKFTVGGHEMTLDEIEGTLRKQLREPRIHFAIVCASHSCPHLARAAYTPENVDRELDMAARAFINDPRNLKIDVTGNRVTVSRIFKWYRGDFEAAARAKGLTGLDDPVLNFIRQYANDNNRRALDALHHPALSYFEYDWTINDIHTSP